MVSRQNPSEIVTRIGKGVRGSSLLDIWGVGAIIRASPLIAIAILWQLMGVANALPYYVVAPDVVIGEMVALLQSGQLIDHTIASLSLVYVGFVGACVAGIAMGVLTGRRKNVGRVFDPLVSSLYPIPKIALFPLFLVWLGIGFESKVVVLAIAVFFPIYVNTNDGVRQVDKYQIWSARNYGASRFRTLKDVIIPSALPHIFSGLRISVAMAFIVLFSTEMIAAREGLGYLVMQAQRGQNFEMMYAAIVSIAILGFAHTWAVKKAETRALYWTSSGEGA